MEEESMRRDSAGYGPVLSDLAREVGALFRQEAEMARCELMEAARQARAGAIKCGVGLAVSVVAGLAIVTAIVLGLTLLLQRAMPTLPAVCLSAAIFGLICGLAAWLLFRSAVNNWSPARFVPRRTMESLKENVRWARKQI